MRWFVHRQSLKEAVFAAGGWLFALLVAITASAQPTSAFRFEQIDDKSLKLCEGERPVLVYNFGEVKHPKLRAAPARSSYVHPLYGLGGEVLTDDFPADHLHHHGLFWGWPHVRIGQREYDLWKMRGIRIVFLRWLGQSALVDRAKLGVENGWYVGDRQVMKEEVWLEVQLTKPAGRNIDLKLSWTPLSEPITLGGAEGKSYGGLTLRFAPRTGTVITVARGRVSEDLLMTRLAWADLSATFPSNEGRATLGAALFVDPRHPDYPPEWMTREYGLLAIGWPGARQRTLAVGKTVTCRYRLWIHRGAPETDEIQQAYDQYVRDCENKP